jgi:hypothetical protein
MFGMEIENLDSNLLQRGSIIGPKGCKLASFFQPRGQYKAIKFSIY